MKINNEIVTREWLELAYSDQNGRLCFEARRIDNDAVNRAIDIAYQEFTGEYSSESMESFELFGGGLPEKCTLEYAINDIHCAVCRIIEKNFYARLTKREAESLFHLLSDTRSTIALAGEAGGEGPVIYGRAIRENWNKTHSNDQF